MQYKKIMVPVDGSEPSLRALQTAVELARDSEDTEICCVRIAPAMDMDMSLQTNISADPFSTMPYENVIDPVTYREFIDNSMARAKKELEEFVAEAIKGLEDRVTIDVTMSGSISAGILDYVEDNQCDFIVMGNRGLGKIRAMLGSVSYNIIQSTDVPVTIVK